MTAKDLTLNIAVNLGRLGRFSKEGRLNRVNQFIVDTEQYLAQLESIKKPKKFEATFQTFKKIYKTNISRIRLNDEWSEEMYTWANILTHRAKLLD